MVLQTPGKQLDSIALGHALNQFFGKKKSDENLSELPRRYTVVEFNVSSKEEDKVKNYMVSNDVHVVDIKRLSTDDRYVHSFKFVIYRKQAER